MNSIGRHFPALEVIQSFQTIIHTRRTISRKEFNRIAKNEMAEDFLAKNWGEKWEGGKAAISGASQYFAIIFRQRLIFRFQSFARPGIAEKGLAQAETRP